MTLLEEPAADETAPTTDPCPRCGAAMVPGQEWCLECGVAARTHVAPTPRWRVPVALFALIATLFVAAACIAFAVLANSDNDVDRATKPKPTKVAPAKLPNAGSASIPGS